MQTEWAMPWKHREASAEAEIPQTKGWINIVWARLVF